MDSIVSDNNLSFIKKVISDIYPKLNLSDLNSSLWDIYGSYVINKQNAKSDLDITVFSDHFQKPLRDVFVYENVPIHLTTVPVSGLIADGENRAYGGYFTGKIVNPHLFLYGNSDLIKTAQESAGKFIGSLAGYFAVLSGKKSFSPSEITCQVFLAYLATDPSFDAYFLCYFSTPNFTDVWDALVKTTIKTLLVAEIIKQDGDKYIYLNPITTYGEFHEQRMRIAARHWSFGAICHGNNVNFYDDIFENAKNKKVRLDPTGELYKKMVSFLKENSGLETIFI